MNETRSRRFAWAAVALSFLAIGVGHIYCGRIAKGLVLYLAWFAIPVLGLLGAVLPPSSVVLTLFVLLPAISIFVIYVYAAIDAFRSARRAPLEYPLRDYNRGWLYGLMIVVQLSCPLALTAGMREFVFEAFYIPVASMSPSILKGDRILVNKLIARRRFPERGDVIVFSNPSAEGGTTFIQRVVALAGDQVVIAGDRVEINGQPLQRDRIPPESLRDIRDQLTGQAFYEVNAGRRYKVAYAENPKHDRRHVELTVPARSVFLLGDNRDSSRDSRYFGAVHVGDIIGYLQYIYWPAQTISRFGVYRD